MEKVSQSRSVLMYLPTDRMKDYNATLHLLRGRSSFKPDIDSSSLCLVLAHLWKRNNGESTYISET